MTVVAPLLVLLIGVIVINMVQQRNPRRLPPALRSWDFLPLWFHSLEPWDNVVEAVMVKCCGCCKSCDVSPENKMNQPLKRESGERIAVSDDHKKGMGEDTKIELNILKISRL